MRLHAAGFTLPEVLATLAIIGLILPMVMQGISLSLGVASDAKRQAEATALAEAKLYELAVTAELSPGLSGDFAPDHPDIRWTAIRDSWGEDGLEQLTVEVTWSSRQRERSLALTTWVRPEQQ